LSIVCYCNNHPLLYPYTINLFQCIDSTCYARHNTYTFVACNFSICKYEVDIINQCYFLPFYQLLEQFEQGAKPSFVVEKPIVYPSQFEPQRTVFIQEQQPVVAPFTPSVVVRTISSEVRLIFFTNKFIIFTLNNIPTLLMNKPSF